MLGLTLLGYVVGSNWDTLHSRLEFLDYAIAAAIVFGLAWLAVRLAALTGDARVST